MGLSGGGAEGLQPVGLGSALNGAMHHSAYKRVKPRATRANVSANLNSFTLNCDLKRDRKQLNSKPLPHTDRASTPQDKFSDQIMPMKLQGPIGLNVVHVEK